MAVSRGVRREDKNPDHGGLSPLVFGLTQSSIVPAPKKGQRLLSVWTSYNPDRASDD